MKKKFLILGYGLSGISSAKLLEKKGFEIIIYDDSIKNKNIPQEFDILVKSPGVPFMPHNFHFLIKKAIEKNIPIISNYDVWAMFHNDARVIAITGTDGKSTTTALTTHILQNSGIDACMGGNIGIPYGDLGKHDIYVFEMSSYELAISKYMNFEIFCLLNLQPDHIENHGSFENYKQAKCRGLDCSKYSITVPDTIDVSNCEGLLGPHNKENAGFAHAICRRLGISSHEILKHMKSFKSLPHRMNVVETVDNITFVNDSKATNPNSAAQALATYFESHKIFWLVGGRSKKINALSYVSEYLNQVYKIYLFGESMNEFANEFQKENICKCVTIENALKTAYKDALLEKNGKNVILFSPMGTSFDQFNNFSERGNFFCKLVQELII